MTEKKIEKWKFIGRKVQNTGSKCVFGHQYVDPGGEVMSFTAPLGPAGKRSHDVIGGVYEGNVSRDDDGGCNAYGNWRYQGQEDTSEQLAEWRAKDINAEAVMEDHNREKRDKATNHILELLEPVRKAYWTSSTVGRRRLLAEIIEFVTRRPR